ncbi:unnamed protein product [Calicophoron daubneyi]|uniref:Uncharacterized protein n=1 Tax=Calicophoron daubneyi TaxID=300641 RepID=A0AAV2T5J5_CALDB
MLIFCSARLKKAIRTTHSISPSLIGFSLLFFIRKTVINSWGHDPSSTFLKTVEHPDNSETSWNSSHQFFMISQELFSAGEFHVSSSGSSPAFFAIHIRSYTHYS